VVHVAGPSVGAGEANAWPPYHRRTGSSGMAVRGDGRSERQRSRRRSGR
jgi:hypothetical protein